MVSIDKAVLARYSKAGKHFEIYVDPVLAMEVRSGKEPNMNEVLAASDIYKDARKGDRAAESSLKETFGTTDVFSISKEIIRKGEIQLTTEQRRKMVEEKKLAVISKIAREAFNPQTKLPHPPQRIEHALEEAHFSVDPFESVESQVGKAIKAIRSIIPISIETFTIEAIIPPEYSGKAYGVIKKYEVVREEWLDNGALKAILKIPAGVESEFYDQLNSVCRGEAQCRRLTDDKKEKGG